MNLFYWFGIACILYCVTIFLLGHSTNFFLIWGAFGIGFGVLGFGWQRGVLQKVCSHMAGKIILGLGGCGILVALVIVGMIFSRFGEQAPSNADYCIVLGAQWNPKGPSMVLKMRLDAAAEYLKSSPRTVAVVSGGKGTDEVKAEADGMKEYLVAAGIEETRIFTENRSANTKENLMFSKNVIEEHNGSIEQDRCVIITNNFHLFRATQIAKKQGYHAEGYAAKSTWWMLPNNILREILGIVKDFAVRNL